MSEPGSEMAGRCGNAGDSLGSGSSGRLPWGAWGTTAVLGGFAVLGIALVAVQAGKGRFSFGTVSYTPDPQWAGCWFPGLLLALMGSLACLVWRSGDMLNDREDGRNRAVQLLVLLVWLKLVLHLAMILFLREFSLAQAVYQFIDRWRDGAYALMASGVRDGSGFLAGYETHVLNAPRDPMTPHLETHPPGFVLYFYGVQRLLDALPGVERWVSSAGLWLSPILEETLADAARQTQLYRHALAVGLLTTALCFALSSTVPMLVYLVAREETTRRRAFFFAAVASLFPGDYAFSPSLELVMCPLALLLCLLGVRAIRRRSLVYGCLFGVASYVSLFCASAFLAPVAMLGLSLLAAFGVAWTRRGGRTLPQVLSAGTYPLAGALCGWVVPLVGLWAFADFNLMSALWTCLRNHRGVYELLGRGYATWLGWNVVELGVSTGLPALAVWLAALMTRVCRALRHPAGETASPFFWGTHAAFLLLAFSGTTRGEVARLWLFLLPVLWVSSAHAIGDLLSGLDSTGSRGKSAGVLVLAFVILQVAWALVLNTVLDPMDAASTFHALSSGS